MKERWTCYTSEAPSGQSSLSFKRLCSTLEFLKCSFPVFCLLETGPVHPCSFSIWYWKIKGSLSLRKVIFLTMKHAKPKTSPSMYCLGCLQNQKHSTKSACLARASAGVWVGMGGNCRWVKRKEGSLLPWEKNNQIFFLRFMSLINE